MCSGGPQRFGHSNGDSGWRWEKNGVGMGGKERTTWLPPPPPPRTSLFAFFVLELFGSRAVFRIRIWIGSVPYSIRSEDPDPDSMNPDPKLWSHGTRSFFNFVDFLPAYFSSVISNFISTFRYRE